MKTATSHPLARKMGFRAFTLDQVRRLGHKPDVGPATGPPISARINHGRWIADCPFCPGAELVDPDTPEFMCWSCANAKNGGRFVRVDVPNAHQRDEIEGLLDGRPQENQNWDPRTEDAAFLRAENLVYGRPRAGGGAP